jgi:hypothetical protein
MVVKKWHSPGYHTTVPDGAQVHPTRDSLHYALALLASGTPEHVERAQAIVRKVLTLQDTDPKSKTYGIWPWLLEEPLEKMSPPDWNWADFCGASLACMLAEYPERLSEGIRDEMRTSLGHAARSIVRRNVGPGYTNIAIMGGGVTAAAGEILGDAELLSYGRNRLAQCVKHYNHHGGFNEYNSPTYTMVALHECERILGIVKDAQTRKHAEILYRACWATVASHFHPATATWAGPHSRAYSPWLRADAVAYLRAMTGARIAMHPDVASDRSAWEKIHYGLPCPEEWRGRFQALPEPPLVVRSRAIKRDTEETSTWITTYLDDAKSLGTVNHDTFWTQRYVLKAHWNDAKGTPVVLRLRFLHDGRDFASGFATIAQNRNRALAALSLVTNQGDWHPSLDRPKDGTFRAKDFRLRYELSGGDVRAQDLSNRRFALEAGVVRAVIHTLPGKFGSEDVEWETGRDKKSVWVDGICYHGPEKSFKLSSIPKVIVVSGLELIGAEEGAADVSPTVGRVSESELVVTWAVDDGFSLRAPLKPHRR